MQDLIANEQKYGIFSFNMARWFIFAILILTYILVYFHRMAPGVVADYLMAAFKISGSQLGSLSAIYFFVYAFMQIPSGVIADTLGTRVSIIGGNLVAGVGSIFFGMATSFELACWGRFLVGLGVSVVFISIMKNNSVWFPARMFGFMSGITLLIGNLGSVMAATPLSTLLNHFTWRSIFNGIGILSLTLSVLAFIFVRNRPEDLDFTAPNNQAEKQSGPVGDNWLKNLASVVTVLRLWPGFWVQFGMIGGLYSLMGLWGMPYLKDVHGLDRAYAANHMTTMLLSFAVGALFWGWFSDRIGRRKPLLVGCTLNYTLCWLMLIYGPWSPGFSGFLLFGFMGFVGAGFVLTFAAAKEIIHPSLSGMAVSVVNTGCFVGTALMQPLFGLVADFSWDGTIINGIRIYSAADYHHGFYLMLFFAAIGVLGSFRVRETYCQNISISKEKISPTDQL